MSRPTFFLSSTIYDFRDLRSALKFYLEELGCKVLASEYCDFEVNLDKHSYDACIEAIHNADYFILLVGTRVGGWYDKENRISITQKEYREAYALQQAGKIKIINFVRADVWNTKEDRIELARFLESTTIDSAQKNTIAYYPSKFADDAKFIIDFVNEISRNTETKKAISGEGCPPVGNWVQTFADFRDIVRAIDVYVLPSEPVEKQTIKRLLRMELRGYLKNCLVKYKEGKVFSPRIAVEMFHEDNIISKDLFGGDRILVKAKSWDRLLTFSLSLIKVKLHPIILPRVLAMPTFLDFDVTTGLYSETDVYNSLQMLESEIRIFMEGNNSESLSVLFEYSPRNRHHKDEDVQIEPVKLGCLLHLVDRWCNIIELSASLLAHIDNGDAVVPRLRPCSPVRGMVEALAEEMVTDEDVDLFVSSLKHTW